MTAVYINLPNPHFVVHKSRVIDERFLAEKHNRFIRITPESFSEAIKPFVAQKVEFGSGPESADMWLEIDFGDGLFELSIAKFLQRALARKYTAFLTAPWR